MKHLIFFIMLLFTASAHAQKPEETPKDTIVKIDGEIYELKTWSRYQIVQDTPEMHNRIVAIDTAIAELRRECALLVTKISYFETNKMSAFRTARPAPAKKNTKPAPKKAATKPKKQ
jgi:hypothetical protein